MRQQKFSFYILRVPILIMCHQLVLFLGLYVYKCTLSNEINCYTMSKTHKTVPLAINH